MNKNETEILEAVQDDVQLRIDNFVEKVGAFVRKEARTFKERDLRQVCVDHPHVEASVVQATFLRLIQNPDAVDYYISEWIKSFSS